MISVRRCCFSTVHVPLEKSEPFHSHIFRKLPYSNVRELKQHLLNNIIFNQNGLILLNKPYGLKKTSIESQLEGKKFITKSPTIESIDHLSFSDVLPLLSHEFRGENVKLVKMPERYISGLSILADCDVMCKRIRRSLGDPSLPLFKYLAVCIGIPINLSDRCKLGVTIREKDNLKKAILLKNYSKNSVIKQLVLPVTMNHITLATNESLNASLVCIENNRNKWHAVRAYCGLRLLAPILGDPFYASCVRTIDKKAVPVDPLSSLANFPAKLAPNLLSALELRQSKNMMIPNHLHLCSVNLQNLERGKVFVAKPPDHFIWTCEKLNLQIPKIYLENGPVSKDDFDFENVTKQLTNREEKE